MQPANVRKKRCFWQEEEIQHLIQLRIDYKDYFSKMNDDQAWIILHREFSVKYRNYTIEQLITKWKLLRQYFITKFYENKEKPAYWSLLETWMPNLYNDPKRRYHVLKKSNKANIKSTPPHSPNISRTKEMIDKSDMDTSPQSVIEKDVEAAENDESEVVFIKSSTQSVIIDLTNQQRENIESQNENNMNTQTDKPQLEATGDSNTMTENDNAEIYHEQTEPESDNLLEEIEETVSSNHASNNEQANENRNSSQFLRERSFQEREEDEMEIDTYENVLQNTTSLDQRQTIQLDQSRRQYLTTSIKSLQQESLLRIELFEKMKLYAEKTKTPIDTIIPHLSDIFKDIGTHEYALSKLISASSDLFPKK